jgi:hypothetical protein
MGIPMFLVPVVMLAMLNVLAKLITNRELSRTPFNLSKEVEPKE